MSSAPLTILGISGSLRRGSFNTALLRTMALHTGNDVTLDVVTLHGIPLYNGDEERDSGIPGAVEALRAKVIASDGLLLGTPEYNNGIPGVFKNAIDWLSRPGSRIPEVFGDRPTALVGASPGGFGTILAQDAWLPVLHTLGTRFWNGGRLMVSRAGQVFAPDGSIQDTATTERAAAFLAGFAAFIRDSRRG